MPEPRPTAAGAYQRIEAHEALCAERYKGIEEKLHWLLAGLASLVFGLLAWMAVQLYALEPLRVAAATRVGAPAIAPQAPAAQSNGTGSSRS
jgi:hypothetical protein